MSASTVSIGHGSRYKLRLQDKFVGISSKQASDKEPLKVSSSKSMGKAQVYDGFFQNEVEKEERKDKVNREPFQLNYRSELLLRDILQIKLKDLNSENGKKYWRRLEDDNGYGLLHFGDRQRNMEEGVMEKSGRNKEKVEIASMNVSDSNSRNLDATISEKDMKTKRDICRIFIPKAYECSDNESDGELDAQKKCLTNVKVSDDFSSEKYNHRAKQSQSNKTNSTKGVIPRSVLNHRNSSTKLTNQVRMLITPPLKNRTYQISNLDINAEYIGNQSIRYCHSKRMLTTRNFINELQERQNPITFDERVETSCIKPLSDAPEQFSWKRESISAKEIEKSSISKIDYNKSVGDNGNRFALETIAISKNSNKSACCSFDVSSKNLVLKKCNISLDDDLPSNIRIPTKSIEKKQESQNSKALKQRCKTKCAKSTKSKEICSSFHRNRTKTKVQYPSSQKTSADKTSTKIFSLTKKMVPKERQTSEERASRDPVVVTVELPDIESERQKEEH